MAGLVSTNKQPGEGQLVEAHHILTVMRGFGTSLPMRLAGLAALCAFMQVHVPAPQVVAWGLGCAGLMGIAARLARWHGSQAEEKRLRHLGLWAHAARALTLATGLALGAAGTLAFPHAPPAAMLAWTYLAFVLPSFILGPHPIGYGLAHGTAMPILMVGWHLWGGELAAPVISALVLFWLVVLLAGVRRRSANRDYISMVLRNEALARQLAQRNESLTAANQSRTAQLVAASHDLRQPVQALGVLLELLERGAAESAPARIRSARACIGALSEILVQLLDVSRLELGLYRPRLERVDMRRLTRELHQSLGAQAESRGLQLHGDCDEAWVRSDPRMLRRILFNLVTNALKFTPAGSITVACRARAQGVVVHVRDTGIGIAKARLKEIFSEYVQLRANGHAPPDGIGLGLSIVFQAAALLGHGLEVESEPGRGTCFTLSLGTAIRAPQRHSPSAPERPSLPVGLIAVLEDHQEVLLGLLNTLRGWGCYAIGARTIAELERQFAGGAWTPVLLLADLHLGQRGDGLEAIEHLRRHWAAPQMPAILLTGDLDPQLELRARACHAWIAHKPIHPDALRGLVSTAAAHGTA